MPTEHTSTTPIMQDSIPTGSEVMQIESVDTIDYTLPKKELSIIAALPTGEKQTVLIPAPTENDISWAKDVLQSNYQDRSSNLYARADESCIWKVFFLLEQNRLRNNSFLDIDYCPNDTTALCQAGRHGKNQNLLLFIHYGADIHKAKPDECTPIRRALDYDKLDTIDLLLSIGVTIDIDTIISSSGYNSTKKHALKQLMNRQKRPIIKQQIASPTATNQTTSSIWAKMDNQIIAHITEATDRFRLNKIFNFQSREIERFTESLNSTGQIVYVSTPVTQEFNSVRHTEEIQVAHIELKSQGGELEPLQHYIRITNHIQHRRRP